MIYNYPHFPTKSYRGYPHNTNIPYPPYRNMWNTVNRNSFQSPTEHKHSKKKDKISDITLDKTKEPEDTYFEILGIKLHYDDILLICLIFFLYKEGVHDEYLFVALIMLLLSWNILT